MRLHAQTRKKLIRQTIGQVAFKFRLQLLRPLCSAQQNSVIKDETKDRFYWECYEVLIQLSFCLPQPSAADVETCM